MIGGAYGFPGRQIDIRGAASLGERAMTDVAAADKMMVQLAGFLRMALESKGLFETTVAMEMGVITSYLNIEKIRLRDRL